MAKQTKRIRLQCGARLARGAGRCINEGTIGVFRWNDGATDVDLNEPVVVVCGCHKINFARGAFRGLQLRNVRLNRSL